MSPKGRNLKRPTAFWFADVSRRAMASPPSVGHGLQAVGQHAEATGRIDVLLAMRAHEEVAALRSSPETIEHLRGVDLRPVGVEHLSHRGAGEQNASGMQPLG